MNKEKLSYLIDRYNALFKDYIFIMMINNIIIYDVELCISRIYDILMQEELTDYYIDLIETDIVSAENSLLKWRQEHV